MRTTIVTLLVAISILSCKKSETFPVEEDLLGAWQYERIEPNDSGTMDTTRYTLDFINIKEVRVIVDVHEDTAKTSYYFEDYEFTLKETDSRFELKKVSLVEELPFMDTVITSKIQLISRNNTLETDADRTFLTVSPFLDSLDGTGASTTFTRYE